MAIRPTSLFIWKLFDSYSYKSGYDTPVADINMINNNQQYEHQQFWPNLNIRTNEKTSQDCNDMLVKSLHQSYRGCSELFKSVLPIAAVTMEINRGTPVSKKSYKFTQM